MSKIIYLTIIWLISCGQPIERVPGFYVDQELQPYYQEFINSAKNSQLYHDIKTTRVITFGDLDFGYVGMCYYYESYRRVTISNDYKECSLCIKWTLYHELGHCILDKQHVLHETDLMFYAIADLIDLKSSRYWAKALIRFWSGIDQEDIDHEH